MKPLVLILSTLFGLHAAAQSTVDTAGLGAATQWATQELKHLSLEQQVGQLMCVRVPLTMTARQQKEFERNFSKYEVGGVCFFKGTATEQCQRTRRFQRLSRLPLMVTIDGEWGLGMRLTDCYSYPQQMLMGALPASDDTLIAHFGDLVGRQCQALGIHANFAPVCDINSNPRNPIIGARSFGEDKRRVAAKSVQYALAMQRRGVIAVGKHFPGHGDTDVDSHLDLPVINHSRQYIDTVDLYPFRQLAQAGIRGMMVAHLQVNALDDRPNMPSSLSERIVEPLLRQQMQFDGLVFTDGIDMQAVAKHYKDGEGAIRALRAGCDVILLPIDVKKTINAVVAEAKRDDEFAKIVADRCFRILREKYRCGLVSGKHHKKAATLTPTWTDAQNEAFKQESSALVSQMAERALTLVRNEDYTLPLQHTDDVVWLALGNADTALTQLSPALRQRIAEAGKIVVQLYGSVYPSKNYSLSDQQLALLGELTALPSVQTALVVYGSPYILDLLATRLDTMPSAIVLAYQNMAEVRAAVPPALYGTTPFQGLLPVTAGGYAPGTSLKATPRPAVDPYARVRQAGLDVACFQQIDSLAAFGISQQAYPGCQILVAKDGHIVYNRCYGHLTYDADAAAVDSLTLYDLASLTKVAATNLAVMRLVDAGKVGLDDKLSRYLPFLKHTNKKHITIRQALSHIARLKAYDAYWKEAVDSPALYFGAEPPEDFVAIGDACYINPDYRLTVLSQIVASKLEKKERYLYSDLGFILLAEMVQKVSGQSLDLFCQQQFYQPMGLSNTTFQPLSHGIDPARIAPTERETTFRKQLIRGYVHDPNAAALGGVAGHAGLFSNATDLWALFQMMLDSGRFDGHQYISAETFNTFNSRHFANKGNRRALGFDKPFINGRSTHIAPMASQQSFGHTGFTGIMAWVDPRYNLVYLFLSNRVYPTASPNKLANLNIRTDIQELIYKSFGVER